MTEDGPTIHDDGDEPETLAPDLTESPTSATSPKTKRTVRTAWSMGTISAGGRRR